jgi:hypothetical protein
MLELTLEGSDLKKLHRPSELLSIVFSPEGRETISSRSTQHFVIRRKQAGGISNKVRSKVNRELEKYSGSLDAKN